MLVALASSSVALAKPRESLDLNVGWKFSPQDDSRASEPAFNDTQWSRVDLPHTWNALDGQDGGDNYRRGAGWYRRVLKLDPALAGRQLYLQFDGASLGADVYLNGKPVGSHLGGFTRFRLDITDAVKLGTDSVVAVRVDNGRLGIAPTKADFTFFGGLYRSVSLLATDRVQIATTDHGSSGVYLAQQNVSTARADVSARVRIENHDALEQPVEVQVTVSKPNGRRVTSKVTTVSVGAGAAQTVEQPLTIRRPHLWNGVADPYQYRVRVEVRVHGRVRDAVEQPLGLRFFRVDANEGFFLNGRHLDLHGVNRHQDRLDKGWAISEADEAEDFALIRELGATAIRVAHYPQSESWYERADRAGLIVWAEIPFVDDALDTPLFLENVQQQLRELIRQNYNHPSICFWGIGNETHSAPLADKTLGVLAALVPQEDRTRLSTYATDGPPEDPHNWHTDVIAWNKYYGWYYGELPDLGPFLDALHAAHPGARIGISEYGAGASIHQHDVHLTHVDPNGPFHPEEFQSAFHEADWAMLKVRPYIWSKFIWNLADFASDRRNEGDTPGRNDKGLVTYDRKTKKDAFYFYKAAWSDEPTVHLTSCRFTPRSEARADIKVYSNAASVEVFVNGISQGKQRPIEAVARWPPVGLKSGQNSVEARATIGGQTIHDRCLWTVP